MAMFPPTLPHFFIQWLSEPGDVVYDPFSGRGTTVLEARLQGRIGLGSDLNPLAVVLSGSKADPPTQGQLQRRLAELGKHLETRDINGEPEQITMLFDPDTLGQLVWIKEQLDLTDRVDRFLMAALLGILHLNASADGTPRGLTVSMPNTFAMSPGYVRKYVAENALVAPNKNVVEALKSRLEHVELPDAKLPRGRVWSQDATASIRGWPSSVPHAKLIFTSPPYLQVIRYGKFNWIRLWLLDRAPKNVDDKLYTSSSLDRYVDFMKRVISSLRPRLREDGYVGLVVGDVRRGNDHLNLAEVVVERCLDRSDLRLVGVIEDQVPVKHKVTRIWKGSRGRATKVDRIVLLAGPESGGLPGLPQVTWAEA